MRTRLIATAVILIGVVFLVAVFGGGSEAFDLAPAPTRNPEAIPEIIPFEKGANIEISGVVYEMINYHPTVGLLPHTDEGGIRIIPIEERKATKVGEYKILVAYDEWEDNCGHTYKTSPKLIVWRAQDFLPTPTPFPNPTQTASFVFP